MRESGATFRIPGMMLWSTRGLLRLGFTLAITTSVILYVSLIHGAPRLNTFAPKTRKLPMDDAAHFKAFYDDVKCITEQSNDTCTFPLLTDYHRRCGYFAGSTSWTNASAGFPWARMSAQICRVPPVSSAPFVLGDYIRARNLTSIVVFGDSQGRKYTHAFFLTLLDAGFKCELNKIEETGPRIQLTYYTEGALFTPNDTVSRTCHSCRSSLYVCVDENGRNVSLEFISMFMANRTPFGGHCNDTRHPLCRKNTTQQEYVLKHYLRRHNSYPQLLLFVSTFPHDRVAPHAEIYDGIRYLHGLITRHVPPSATVIWYNAPAWHPLKHTYWSTSEGQGYSPNDKMQVENRFLAKVQAVHYESGLSPPMYSFFDLYHMDEQLRGAWDADQVHYTPDWYSYVIRYTIIMLPSTILP